MDQYAKNFNRIADCVERRTALLGRQPRLSDIPEQLAIRGRVLRRSTVNAEISSVRRIVENAQMEGGRLILHEDCLERAWITGCGEEELALARAGLGRSIGEIIDLGESVIERDLAAVGAAETMGTEEITDVLAGRVRPDVQRFDQKGQKFITWRDLRLIEMELGAHDPLEAVMTLKEGQPCDAEGLLRVFSTVMWFTGMRPVEVWSSALFVPRTDIPFTPEMAEMVRKAPKPCSPGSWSRSRWPRRSCASTISAKPSRTPASPPGCRRC